MGQPSLLRCDAFRHGMQSSKDKAPELRHSYSYTRPTHLWQFVKIVKSVRIHIILLARFQMICLCPIGG